MQNSTGILFINTGTPEKATYWGVRKYLSQFLSDPRVIDLPAFARFLLLQGVILPFRSYQSAQAYSKIWTEKGSPLLVHSLSFAEKVQKSLGSDYLVAFGMRYGKPSIKDAWERLKGRCSRVLVFPLFPHYASSSTGSALEEAYTVLSKDWNLLPVRSIGDFYSDKTFQAVYSRHIEDHLKKAEWEHVVFSFHGLPQHHIEKSGCMGKCPLDACEKIQEAPLCYRAQAYEMVRLFNEHLGLGEEQFTVAFQSRLGKRPWIQPYFDELLPKLFERGLRRIAVVCPSFVSDCLETLEEIQVRALESWKELGGVSLTLIPCLNDAEAWVEACAEIIKRECLAE